MRDQVTFYLDRARAAARAGAIGVATPAAPALAGMARAFDQDLSARRSCGGLSGRPALSRRETGFRRHARQSRSTTPANGRAAKCGVGIEPPTPNASGERLFLRALIDDDGPGLAPNCAPRPCGADGGSTRASPAPASACPSSSDLAEAYGGGLELADLPLWGACAPFCCCQRRNSVDQRRV